MTTSPEVDAWFKDFDHPLKDAMLRAREIILASDSRITECIKWKTPTFTYKGNLASFNPRSKKHVSILFHTGAHIPGSHPQLGGGAGTARYMALPTITDVEAARKDIAAVVKAWCDWKSAE